MRIVSAVALSVLSACSNPWGSVPVSELPKPLRYVMARPSHFVFGNYCGFGTRTGDLTAKPVDRLDTVCYAHDSCYVDRRNHCDCDGALVRGAANIRDDTRSPKKMRRQAALLIATFAVPVCKAFPQGFMPPRPRDRREFGLPGTGAEGAG
jgi:hypothetical protein